MGKGLAETLLSVTGGRGGLDETPSNHGILRVGRKRILSVNEGEGVLKILEAA